MQALSDDQQMDRLEKKVDRIETRLDAQIDRLDAQIDRLDGKIEVVRIEARSDFRTLLGVQLTTIVAMILGFAALFLQHA